MPLYMLTDLETERHAPRILSEGILKKMDVNGLLIAKFSNIHSSEKRMR